MSGNKYADLPDIDTAPDIYETDDVFPPAEGKNVDSSDDDSGFPSRSTKLKQDVSGREELDYSNLAGAEQASKKFRKAEKKRLHTRTQYAYPPSPNSPASPTDPSSISRAVPLSHRLRALQSELLALENELADPSNPLIQREREEDNIDPGELIRGIVDVRTRLDKIKKGKEGRARLVEAVLEAENDVKERPGESVPTQRPDEHNPPKTQTQIMVDMDKRVGELEGLIGSSSASLDEGSPLPTPLLPLISRLQNQLTILSQPRHIDAISRRLKLLLSDLERASSSHGQGHRRQPSQPNGQPQIPTLQDQLLPLLSRLSPLLPHIPHILSRLRTLSTLHTSATEFQTGIEELEVEQKKLRGSLHELGGAVRTVEASLNENREVVKNNVLGLERRVNSLVDRLENLRLERDA